MPEFVLETSAFGNTDAIPQRHTCDGDDIAPPLRWSNAPEGTRSLALVVEDPDAPSGVFTHWLAWGLDPSTGELREGERPPSEGRNDFGSTGYRGPCPPRGHGLHRYVFRLYALDAELGLAPGASKPDLEQALRGHALGSAELMGTYERGTT